MLFLLFVLTIAATIAAVALVLAEIKFQLFAAGRALDAALIQQGFVQIDFLSAGRADYAVNIIIVVFLILQLVLIGIDILFQIGELLAHSIQLFVDDIQLSSISETVMARSSRVSMMALNSLPSSESFFRFRPSIRPFR